MSASIPTTEPTTFAKGETVKWTRSLSDYSAADGWQLDYYIRGPQYLDVTATTSGSSFAVTISATETANLDAGFYWWEARVSKSGEVYKVDSGTLQVKVDLSMESAGYEGGSIARRALKSIESVILNRATRDDLNYTLPGVGMSVGKIPPEELLKWYDYFKAEVKRENDAEKLANGGNTGRNIYVRFSAT